ncbi:VWA domain-containing protein [Oceanospirillum sediminis]|uniref:VWA domain-containing protein n=1 Tax=Oceanospirillum sediminis TaxID=2760088 RepID=A0A839IRE4_9GAMM|nr:vWA domain-containing protein [Oceanospirillum sediminis]MBB1487069.1 VWA domain-containing protein [Oceanospirillum sediminis]
MASSLALFSGRTLLIVSMMIGLMVAGTGSTFAANQKPDVRVLIDISGSMKENDPNNLRVPALNLLVDLLPEDSRAGVWTFGAYVNQLVPHEIVDDNWRSDARSRSRQITSSALFTDIENAIERSVYDINRPTDYERHVILLTDGLVDISEAGSSRQKRIENNQSRDDIQYDLLPRLQKAGVTVHTVALSDNADKDLMLKLAQRTGGLAAVANNAEELMQLFVQALDRTAPNEQVPLENNRFLVDSSINEFTALIFHKPNSQRVFLISPSGKRYTSLDHPDTIKWHYETRYDLITVKDPEDGEWLVETEMHPDSRVTVVSDLSLKVSDVPAMLYRGLSLDIEASVYEEGELITRNEFLKVMSLNAEQLSDNDKILQADILTRKPSAKGYFETNLGPFNKTGNYRIKVNLDGKTFQRSISQPVFVQDIVSSSLDNDDAGDPKRIFFTRVLPELKANDIQIKGTVMGMEMNAKVTSSENWVMDLPELDRNRKNVIRLFAKGIIAGEPVEVELEPIVIPSLAPEPQVQAIDQETSVDAEQLPQDGGSGGSESSSGESSSGSGGSAAGVSSSQDDETPKKRMNLLDPNDQPLDPGPGGSNLLWIYLGVGLVNIALFAGAFWLYRRFIQKRSEKKSESAERDDDIQIGADNRDDASGEQSSDDDDIKI